MVVLRKDGVQRLSGVGEILEIFYRDRLPFYEQRVIAGVRNLEKHIKNLQMQVRFVTAIQNKTLDVMAEEATIRTQLAMLDVPYGEYTSNACKRPTQGKCNNTK